MKIANAKIVKHVLKIANAKRNYLKCLRKNANAQIKAFLVQTQKLVCCKD